MTCNNKRRKFSGRTQSKKSQALILPRCFVSLGLVEQKSLTSSGLAVIWCCVGCLLRWRARVWRPQTPGEDFAGLSLDALALTYCRRCLAECRGMRAPQLQAALCRHICHGKVRGARSRGPESSSVGRRAVLGHSIVDRSTRSTCSVLKQIQQLS